MRRPHLVAGALALAAAAPALAQEDRTAPPPPVAVTGSASILTDDRFRGVSRSDDDVAVQLSLTAAHESGFYVGAFGATRSGWGAVGGADVEIDAVGGWKHDAGGATTDVGVTWYTYPGGAAESDVVEFFGRLSGTIGPAGLTAGVAYAPKQTSLGNFSATPRSRGRRGDNLYLTGDGNAGIPGTPVTARAHVGYSNGNPGLGPNRTSLAPTGAYWDWSFGADVAIRGDLTLGLSYVDTDIGRREAAYLRPDFSKGRDGTGRIAGPTVMASLTATF